MAENQKEASPVFRLDVGGKPVTVRFSSTGASDVKNRIREILTESYGERLQDSIQACAEPV